MYHLFFVWLRFVTHLKPNVYHQMAQNRSWLIILLLMIICQYCKSQVKFINPIRLPYGGEEGPFMGIFVAIAIPLELPNTNVFVSYNFEANYDLPKNQTEFEYPPLVSRSFPINRKYIYDALEFKLISHGYPGKSCLLRTICEAAESTIKDNGVLGDILHILLTPSSSENEKQVSSEYLDAENYGKSKQHCKKYTKKCKISLLSLISWLENNF